MTDQDAALRRVTTTELSIKGKVCCTAAAASANTLFVGTESALWIVTNGFVALLAGHQSRAGCKDGQGTEARFQRIRGLAQERTGGILVSDNHCLRRVSPHGQVTTVLGSGESGFADGKGAAARFNHPCGIVITVQGIFRRTASQLFFRRIASLRYSFAASLRSDLLRIVHRFASLR